MTLSKPKKDWDKFDKNMAQLNTKAIYIFYCSFDIYEFNRILTCTYAKKIWDKLEVTHEGISQVKEFKINLLVHKYEIFKIESQNLFLIYSQDL